MTKTYSGRSTLQTRWRAARRVSRSTEMSWLFAARKWASGFTHFASVSQALRPLKGADHLNKSIQRRFVRDAAVSTMRARARARGRYRNGEVPRSRWYIHSRGGPGAVKR